MAIPIEATKPKSAKQMLEVGNLSREAINGTQGYADTDFDKFVLVMENTISVDVRGAITGASLTRTIEGASTLDVTLTDPNQVILNSGKLARRCDVKIDGLWFRLCRVKYTGTTLTLTFEDRIINILRTYAKKMGPIARTTLTRAQFIEKMLNEVREFEIPRFIPELVVIQPIADTGQDNSGYVGPIESGGGIPPNAGHKNNEPTGPDAHDRQTGKTVNNSLTIKGAPADKYQIAIANLILRVGKSQGANRKVLVCSMMTGIQESGLHNLTDAESPGTRSGVFQQDPRYWPASGDVGKDAAAFFEHCIGADRTSPNLAYHLLCEAVQGSGLPLAYSKRRTEAERLVTEFGVPGGDKESNAVSPSAYGNAYSPVASGDNEYYFYRGKPPTSQSAWKPESSWECIQRLADDVQWRAFFVGSKFYYCDEQYLFKSGSVAVLDRETVGVDAIDFDSDQNKQQSVVTITAWMSRWAAPPGSVVTIRNNGPSVGRYLVTEVSRDLFKKVGTITLKKPWLSLPEPDASNLSSSEVDTGYAAGPDSHDRTDDGTQTKDYYYNFPIVQPIPRGVVVSLGPTHDTAGLPGFPAIDFMCAEGSPVLAVESGTINRPDGSSGFSGNDPSLGAVSGAGGPLGWSIYLKGDSGTNYYYTHLEKRLAKDGQRVVGGTQIATVANYHSFGRGDHTHFGVQTGGKYNIEDFRTAQQAVEKKTVT